MKRILIASGLLALTSLSAGCGLTGPLERPAPMWGSERARYKEQQREAQAAAEAKKEAERPHVDIPVSNDAANPAATPTGAAPALAKPVTPSVEQSGGAVAPVEDINGTRNSRY